MKNNGKYFQITCWLLLAFPFMHAAIAQPAQMFAIESHPIEVSAERTVAISFPFAITSVDRGSNQILAQKAKGTQNVLLLKAVQKQIAPTSLIVITSDAAIHSFEVSYHDQPNSLILQPNGSLRNEVQSADGLNDQQISQAIDLAREHPSNIRKQASNGGIYADLDGLFIKDEVMLLRLEITNESLINYELESIRMFASDRRQVKRTASQHEEIFPLNSSSDWDQIYASEQKSLVLVIPKMTLPKGKRFSIEVKENGGARHLKLTLTGKQLRRVSAL
jgi:conjugative transposon TraN protein